MTSTGHLYGAGVYAEVYCTSSVDYNPGDASATATASVDWLPSNCA
jgi:hypothetical protein